MSLLINEISIDWDSSKSYYYFNKDHPQAHNLKKLSSQLPFFSSHIYLFTSGFQKICILSKESFLLAAQSVNKHLECHSKDKWLISLPLFHVGGLSILARSFSGKYSWVQGGPWEARRWKEEVESQKITLSSLVPAQVYDLVKNNLIAPRSLRAVIVGGSSISPHLYKKARDLNYPLLPSYGLTEACSQVATAELSSLKTKEFPQFKILSHVEVKEEEGVLRIKSPSLLKGYFHIDTSTFEDPKDKKGWLQLEDIGEKKGGYVSVKGRKNEQIKILGEMVNFKHLCEKIKELTFSSPNSYELLAVTHERQGYELNLVTDSFHLGEIYKILKKFNEEVLPYEKLQKIYCVKKIEKNALLKVQQKALYDQVGIFDKIP